MFLGKHVWSTLGQGREKVIGNKKPESDLLLKTEILAQEVSTVIPGR